MTSFMTMSSVLLWKQDLIPNLNCFHERNVLFDHKRKEKEEMFKEWTFPLKLVNDSGSNIEDSYPSPCEECQLEGVLHIPQYHHF